MSGNTVGSVVGGVIGAFFGGNWQIGMMIGGAIGGALDPQVIEGPKIGDAQKQTAQAGGPRPVVYYHPAPFQGNIIDGERIARKITKKVQQGKGGPVTKEEHFLLTTAIGVCEAAEGEEIDYLRIWEDGVCVYDARTTFPPGWEGYSEEIQAKQAEFLSHARLYRGGDSQLPDPALEALEHNGVGNTPCYRGTAYIVVEDADRTMTRGTAGTYLFEVTKGGVTTVADSGMTCVGWWPLDDAPDLIDGQTAGTARDLSSFAWDGTYANDVKTGPAMDSHTGGAMEIERAGDTDSPAGGAFIYGNPADGHLHLGSAMTAPNAKWAVAISYARDAGMEFTGRRNIACYAGSFQFGFVEWIFSLESSGGVYSVYGGYSAPSTDGVGVQATGISSGRFMLVSTGTHVQMWVNGVMVDEIVANGVAWPGGSDGIRVGAASEYYNFTGCGGSASNLKCWVGEATEEFIRQDAAYFGHFAGSAIPGSEDSYWDPETGQVVTGSPRTSVSTTDGPASAVEADVCARCGVPPDVIDFSVLDDVLIPGLLVASQDAGARVLEPIMGCLFHDIPEYDGMLVARLRGGATVVELDPDLFLEADDDNERTRPDPIDFPVKVTVVTQDPNAEYAPIPSTSLRYSPDIVAESEVLLQCPIPFDADRRAQIAQKLHKLLWAQAEATEEVSLGPDYCNLIPSDPVLYDNRRWIITKVDRVDGCALATLHYERASNFESTVTGLPVEPPTPPVGSVRGPTMFMALNLPPLRAQDNVPGVYIAAQGVLTGWQGADIYMSTDGGATYQNILEVTLASTMGYLTEDVTASSEPISVLLYTDETLENMTPEQVVAGGNAAVIVSGVDVAEIIGFETADEVGTREWELSDVTRDGLSTGAAAHDAGDLFTMLDAVYFLPLDKSLAGTTILFRPVSKGTSVDANPVISFVYNPPESMLDPGPHLRIDGAGDYRIGGDGNYRETR